MAKKFDDKAREARLYAGLAGAGATMAEKPSLAISQLLLNPALEAGVKPYSAESLGKSLDAVDPNMLEKIKAYQKHLNAEKIPAFVGEYHAVATPQSLEMRRDLMEKLKRFGIYAGKKPSMDPFIQLVSPNAAAAAHEVGHSVRSPVMALSRLMSMSSPIGKALGVGSGMAMAMSDNETVQNLSPLAAAAAFAPEIAEEARASFHGLRAIKAVDGMTDAIKGFARMSPAFMSYVLGALPFITAPMVAATVKNKLMSKEGAVEPKATGRNIISARQQWTTPAPKPKTSTIGKPGTNAAPPPSKRKFFADLQKVMDGMGDRSL